MTGIRCTEFLYRKTFLCCSLLMLALTLSASGRVWTDVQGRTIEADVISVDLEKNEVRLKLKNEKEYKNRF